MATPHIPQFLLLGRRRVDLLARRFEPWPPSEREAQLGCAGRLTRTEAAILRLLAAHAPATVAREELLRALWNLAARSSRTLDTHVTRLRRKLEDDPSAPRHLMTVYRVGYRLEWAEQGGATGPASSSTVATPPAIDPASSPFRAAPPSSNGHFGPSNSAAAAS